MTPDELQWELGELESMAPAVEALDAKLAEAQSSLETAMNEGDTALELAANEVEDSIRGADESDQLAQARAALQ